jgi:DNA polymerase
MKYPTELMEEIKEKSAPYKLEGFLSGNEPLHATAMLVGEAPGKTELETKVPFSGQAGKELDAELAHANLRREDLYITSVVRRRPYHIKERINKKTGAATVSRPNRTPTKSEVKVFAPLIDFEIQTIQPKIIAPMGNVALKRLLGNQYAISTYHGQVLEQPILKIMADRSNYELTEESYLIFPIYHSAAVLYNRSLKQEIEKDWHSLFQLIKKYS